MEKDYTDDLSSIDEVEYKRYLENTVFEICDENQRLYFLAWVLNVSDNEIDKGIEFLKANNVSFKILYELISRLGKCTIVVEDHYVDRVYRDSYYFYYSGKHFSYSRYCKRLSIFGNELEKNFFDYSSDELNSMFIGTIVIRPVPNRSIGRTLIDPHRLLHKMPCQIRLTKYNVTVYGKKLTVKAFPYSMQDGETTSCAEITILNLLDYYSQTYPEYHYLLPSEICQLAEKNSYERRIPTTGLSYELISRIFCDVGFYPRLYATHKMSKIKFQHIMHYYVESGIPVALGLKLGVENKHSVICVGHSFPNKTMVGKRLTCAYDSNSKTVVWVCDTADIVDTYCIMDDNSEPYLCEICKESIAKEKNVVSKLELNNYEIEYMMVPLYKRMILESSDAYSICMSILADQRVGILNCLKQEYIIKNQDLDLEKLGTLDKPFVIRLFMASSRSFRNERDSQFSINNNEVRDLYNMTIFPKFVWVCEISNKELYDSDKILGEIIIDATSSADAKIDSSIIIHYPYTVGRRMPKDIKKTVDLVFERLENWNCFDSFSANLTNYHFN